MLSAFIHDNLVIILVIIFLLGIVTALVISRVWTLIILSFRSKAQLIRRYWIFVLPFAIVTILFYAISFTLVSPEHRALFSNTVGQIATLTFAIFAGYLAFLQLSETRTENLKARIADYIHDGDFPRAAKIASEICAAQPKDFYMLANLLEISLSQGDFTSYEYRKGELEKLIQNKQKDNIIIIYLNIISHLLKQHIGDADEHLKSLVNFKKKFPDAKPNWNFGDIKRGEIYKKLPEDSESKRKIDNAIRYITNSLNQPEKVRFEDGDYLLS